MELYLNHAIIVIKRDKVWQTILKYDYHLYLGTEVDDKNANYHVRINGNTILYNAEISERLVRECMLSKADIAAVLLGLKDIVVDVLVHGNTVSLDGICKIEPILGVDDEDCTGKEDGTRIGLKAVCCAVASAAVRSIGPHQDFLARKDFEADALFYFLTIYTKIRRKLLSVSISALAFDFITSRFSKRVKA